MHPIDPRIIIIQIAITGLCVFWIFTPMGMLCEILFLMGFLIYLGLYKEAVRLGFWFGLISALYALVSALGAPQAIERPIFLLRKMSPLVGVMMLSLKAMSVSGLIAGLEKMHCPKSITLALAVALRFIPTISQELVQIKNAMKTRGIPLSFNTFVRAPAVTTEYMLIPFMMRSVKVADELAAAAVTRGVENPAPRGMRIPLKIRIKDVVYLGLVICTNIGTLIYSHVG